MTNRSILIFDRKLTLAEVRKLKTIASAKSFRRMGRIEDDLALIGIRLLDKKISKHATMYELKDHGPLLFLILSGYPLEIMYRADDISEEIIKDFLKFANFYEFFLKYKIQHLYAEIDDHNKRLTALSISPHNNSLKDLVSTMEASVQNDISAVKSACVQYFSSLAPS